MRKITNHMDIKKGDMIPQTVESLHLIMERDAIAMEHMAKDIEKLKEQLENTRRKLEIVRSRRGLYEQK